MKDKIFDLFIILFTAMMTFYLSSIKQEADFKKWRRVRERKRYFRTISSTGPRKLQGCGNQQVPELLYSIVQRVCRKVSKSIRRQSDSYPRT